MNDSFYGEYMRNVLGFQNTYDINFENYEIYNIQNEEMGNCYPEIYRIIYPMIQKVCMQNTRPITRELIDNMTEEIYFAIEDNELLESRGKEENNTKESKQISSTSENRQRVIRNRTLNDLIRILILRELFGRPGFPGRPQFPRPPRPPMRPPMRPFNRQSYYDENLFES